MSEHRFYGMIDLPASNNSPRYDFDERGIYLTGGIMDDERIHISLDRARGRLEPLEEQRATMARHFGQRSNAARIMDDCTRSLLWAIECAERSDPAGRKGG